jgi:hypothetical protein|tara:strand:- start:3099 stop:3428 length:330 start_codon:yes stop_codon:yes gene_type:complete
MADETFRIEDKNDTALPSYINTFIDANKDNLKSIYDTNSANKEGFLYLACDEPNNNVDVSFLESTHYNTIITDTEKKTWEQVKAEAEEGNNNIYIVRDNTYKLIIIIYI